jgi:hypothetical protein
MIIRRCPNDACRVGVMTMAVFSSVRPRMGGTHDSRAVDYCIFGLVIGFLCVIVFMLLLGVTHGWSPNNP